MREDWSSPREPIEENGQQHQADEHCPEKDQLRRTPYRGSTAGKKVRFRTTMTIPRTRKGRDKFSHPSSLPILRERRNGAGRKPRNAIPEAMGKRYRVDFGRLFEFCTVGKEVLPKLYGSEMT